MKTALRGLRVLVTRPKNQAAGLINALTQAGAKVIHYPVLEIEATADSPLTQTILADLGQFKVLIFISTNAVRFAAQFMEKQSVQPSIQLPIQLPSSAQCLSIGQATSAALQQYFGNTSLFPQNAADSESLLELEALQQNQISGHKILIVRGEGGRETLKQQLQQRGAEVQYLELYRRVSPEFSSENPNPLPVLLKNHGIDLITVTSGQSLEYLTELAEHQKGELKALPLLTPSARVADIAQRSGFKKLIQSRGARDTEIVEGLINWRRNDQNGR
ncbi:MAG: uroporphyrinogen-III synthase [Pseudomonadales bacterium]|nr:uroporphyrinogen-III synthase [Pseudomonadales bacterium]